MKIKHDKTVISSEMLEHAKKEIVMDDDFIKSIMKKERFRAMTPDLKIGRIRNNEVLSLKFSCHHDLNKFNEVPRRNQHLVTGFGPTNAPTGGTLSIILRALFFRKTTNIDSTIIISNLGAFDSRNINFEKIWYFFK